MAQSGAALRSWQRRHEQCGQIPSLTLTGAQGGPFQMTAVLKKYCVLKASPDHV